MRTIYDELFGYVNTLPMIDSHEHLSCQEGLFRAATSLRQMLRRGEGKLPFMRLQDKPDIARRGYMIDISRGRKPRMETIKTMIDFMAELKYNEFQLYMEGDCFKYAAYPKETAHFDCLTPENILKLDQYCRNRFIDLVPNQNSFGHMYTGLKKPDFHHLGLFEREDEVPSTLNPHLCGAGHGVWRRGSSAHRLGRRRPSPVLGVEHRAHGPVRPVRLERRRAPGRRELQGGLHPQCRALLG